jgi:hypothetical protein
MDGTCRAGPEIVTVTPGSAADVESDTLPLMPLVACAAAVDAKNSKPSIQYETHRQRVTDR